MTATEFVQALVIALVPSLAVLGSAWIGLRDFGMRRRLESSREFLTLIAQAHGRPAGRESLGVGEQIATIHLIADFARREPSVKGAARAGLSELTKWDQEKQSANPASAAEVMIGEAARAALARLNAPWWSSI